MSSTAAPSIALDRLARLEQLLERQDILDCQLRFSRGMDRFDRELFLSAFHADAIIDAGVFVGGPVELYAWAAELHEQGQKATLHYLLNHSCDLDGDVAHTETYYLFTARNRDDTNWIAGGRYIDRLERREGSWKIAQRCNAIEWSGMASSMPIPFADVPDIRRNGAASRSREDLSYRRPLTNRRPVTYPKRVSL
jgi:SnoaL-like domain